MCIRDRVRSQRLAWRVAAAITVAAGLVAVIFTLSRSTWLGLVVSATILLIYGLASRGLLPRQVLAALAAALALALLLNLATGGDIVQRLTQPDGGSALSRLPMSQGALRIISDHPLLGSGLNNYELTIRQYDITGKYTLAGQLPIVHNLFLLIAAETGVLGLLAVLWLLLALARTGLGFVRGREASFHTWLAVGIMAGGLHVVIHNSLHVGIAGDTQLALMVWLLIGSLVAVANSPQPAPLPATTTGRLARQPRLPSLAE
jgi:O-antigen ligase